MSALHFVLCLIQDNIAQLTAQVTDLKRQYDDLYRIQQQILYIFARYMKAYPLPPQMDGNLLTAPVPPAATGAGEERGGGKRQRLLGDGSSQPAYSNVDALSVPSISSGVSGSALMQVPLSSSAGTLAALLSSPSPAINLPSLVQPAAAAPPAVSAREAEIVELNALQAVLSQVQGLGHSQLGGMQLDPATAAALAAALSSYNTRGSVTGAGVPAAATTQPAVQGNSDANNALAALAAPGGPLSHLSPLMLSALTALGGSGAPSVPVPQQQPQQQQQQQAPLAPQINSLASVNQLSGLSSLSALPPLSTLSGAAAPLSAQDLLQLLQHAHPDNRASRLSAIRQEQRMLEDEDDEMDDEDEQQYDNNDPHYGGSAHHAPATAGDWLSSTAASMMHGMTSAALDGGGFNRIGSPRRSSAAVVESKLPTSTPFFAGTAANMFDSYSAQQAATAIAKAAGLSNVAPFKTQEIGSLYSTMDDPYLSSLHSQLAAASSSQNAASSVSMSSSIVSPATPLHLKPSSSITHDGGVVLTPQLHATLSQLLSGSHALLPSSVEGHTLSHYNNAAYTNGHVSDGFTHPAMADGPQDGQAPNLSLVSQLQAIANVSRHLQNMYHPNITSSVYPSTVSAAYDPTRGGQQQQQQPAGFPPPTGFTSSQTGGHSSHSLMFDDKFSKSNATVGHQFYQPPLQQHQQQQQQQQPSHHHQQQHHQPAMPFAATNNHPALAAFAPSPTPYSHPFVGDAITAGTDAYLHSSSASRHSSGLPPRVGSSSRPPAVPPL